MLRTFLTPPSSRASWQPSGSGGSGEAMLTTSTLGMVVYGLYSAGLGVAGLLGLVGLEVWANLGLIGLGLLLMLSAAFVRVRLPGGLALALSAMLGLQALALHNDLHFFGRTVPLFQIARGAFALVLVGLAVLGARAARSRVTADSTADCLRDRRGRPDLPAATVFFRRSRWCSRS